jgi:hypothetical protein
MGQTGRRIALVILGLAMALLIAPAAQAARKSDPQAHVACAPTGCTEVSTDQLPVNGYGETMTDTIPSDAGQGSILAAPTCSGARDRARAAPPMSAGPLSGPGAHVACGADAVTAFTQMLDTVISDLSLNNTNVTKKKNQRVIACAFLSLVAVNYQADFRTIGGGSVGSYTTVSVNGGTDAQAAYLGLCLQVAAAISAIEESGGTAADRASAGCSQGQAALTVSLTRARGRLRAKIQAPPRLWTRSTALAVSCRRSGAGLKLAIAPRRHRTFRQVGVKSLAIGYVNKSKTPLAIRTTFKVN